MIEDNFNLINQFYEIKYPSNWKHEITDGYIDTIYDELGLGVLQVSCFTNNEVDYQFVAEIEMMGYENARSIKLGNLNAIQIIEDQQENGSRITKWITGSGRIMLLLTYTIAINEIDNEGLKKEYQQITKIIESVRINSPAANTGYTLPGF